VSLAAPAHATALPLSESSRALRIACAETGETFDDVYWARGLYLPDALARLNWILRDFHRNEATRMDVALIDLLAALAHHLQSRQRFLVTSAYRTPQTNRRLRVEGLPAACHSTHVLGKAVDVRLERVPLSHLYRAARAIHGGGIGVYSGADFIHLDTGQVRRWTGIEAAPRPG
jgi:uncharacterized protein YcbK (DUF882 family)